MRFKSKGSVDDQFEGHSKWQRQYGQWTLHRDPINQNTVNVFRNHFASDKVDSFIKVLLVALRGSFVKFLKRQLLGTLCIIWVSKS